MSSGERARDGDPAPEHLPLDVFGDDDSAPFEVAAAVVGGAAGAATSSGVSASELPILVTGICGRLGKSVARRLHRDRAVVGVDRRPFPDKPKDIVHHQLDLRRKKIRDVLKSTQFGAVVHLGVLHDPRASAADLRLASVG